MTLVPKCYKKYNLKLIHVEPFHAPVLCTNNLEDYHQFIKRLGLLVPSSDGMTGFIDTLEGFYIMYVNPIAGVSVIFHEALHIAINVAHAFGVDISYSNSEFLTYTMEAVAQQYCEALGLPSVRKLYEELPEDMV